MKKSLSILLILAILNTFCGGALAYAGKLPTNLKEIGEGAFSGTASLGEVELPWGTEAIESRAFSNSGATKIYIPATVCEIAEDAFAGCGAVICSPDGSYAQEYAERKGLAWENCGDYYFPSGTEDVSLTEEIEKLEVFSTDGIDVEEILTLIDEYNAIVVEINGLIDQYNEDLNDFAQALASMEEIAANTAVEETEKAVVVSIGQSRLSVDKDVYTGQDNIVGVSFSDDGQFEYILESGKKLYVIIQGDSAEITSDSGTARSGFSRTARGPGNDAIDFANDPRTGYVVSSAAIGVDVHTDALQKMEKDLNRSYAKLNMIKNRSEKWELENTAKKAQEQITKNRELQKLTHSRLTRLGIFTKAFAAADVALLTVSASVLQAEWGYANALGLCGHPTEEDLNSERAEIAIQYEYNLEFLKKILRSENIALAVQGAITAASLGGKALPVPVQVGLAGGFLLRGLMLDQKKQQLLDALYEAEPMLHSTVYGIVTEAGSEIPISNVRITNGRSAAVTNENGGYYMPLLPGEHTLVYMHDDYYIESKDIALSQYDSQQADMELRSKKALVHGKVRDFDTEEPIPGTFVYSKELADITDDEGKFSLFLPAGSYQISFRAYGYKPDCVPITLSEGQDLLLNWLLRKYPSEELGLVEGYAYDEKTNEKLAETAIYIGDDTEPSLFTDKNGYYSLYLPAEETKLTFRKEGYIDYQKNAAPQSTTIRVDAPMKPENSYSTVDIWTGIKLTDIYGFISHLSIMELADRGYYDVVWLAAPGINLSWQGNSIVTGSDGRGTIVFEGDSVTVRCTGTAEYNRAAYSSQKVDMNIRIERIEGSSQFRIVYLSSNNSTGLEEGETDYKIMVAEFPYFPEGF